MKPLAMPIKILGSWIHHFNAVIQKWFSPDRVWLRNGNRGGHGNVGYGQGNNFAIAACPKANFI
jgi:hypothetical protein